MIYVKYNLEIELHKLTKNIIKKTQDQAVRNRHLFYCQLSFSIQPIHIGETHVTALLSNVSFN